MVVPTRRLLALTLCGVVLIVVAGSAGSAAFLGAIWLVAMAALAIVDTRFVPARRHLEWERHHDARLSLGVWNPVTLRLHNRSRRPARLRVRDATPQLLLARDAASRGVCPPGGAWEHKYSVYPTHRGDYRLGPVAARYLGPLGLAWRQYTTELGGPVKVYPNLLAVRQYDALARRGHLQEMGLRRTRRLGAGTEFERLRDYTPDDEFRRINWTATARRHTPVTVEYETERSQNVLLMLDAGRLMATQVPYAGELESSPLAPEHDGPRETTPALTKLDHAVNAALLLAYVSQEYGDRVGLLAFSDSIARFVKPAPGRRQFLTLTESMHDLQPRETEPDYSEAAGYLAVQLRRRSLIVLFTDIGHEAAARSLLTGLGLLVRRHLPLVVTMRDPAIEKIASESVADVRSAYERAVAQDYLESRDNALARLRRHGALTLDVPADKLTPSVINRYLEIKARAAL